MSANVTRLGGWRGKRQRAVAVAAAFVAIVTYSDVVDAFSDAQLSSHRGVHPMGVLHSMKDEGHAHDDFVDSFRRRRRRKNLDYWGYEHLSTSPSFPSTFEEVADETFRAIAGTICGLQRPDPNVASNAMHRSVLDYRPTHPKLASRRRWADGDDPGVIVQSQKPGRKEKNAPVRMGIEIDGAAHLLPGQSTDEGKAMRMLSLKLAQRLSALPWDVEGAARPRSVAIYFNSLDQTLLASRELSRWKEVKRNNSDGSLDHIHIHCLGQDPLPSSMVKQKKPRVQEESNVSNTDANPEEGIVLIVKPTDYDTNSLIPIHASKHQPTIQANVVDKLQSLLFQASASSIPAVVVSPRLSELPPLQQLSGYKRTGPSGFEQSGFQKSATYGGLEPPVGPTSWLLRDLVPPVYVWVGCANAMGQKQSHRSLRSMAASIRAQHGGSAKESDDERIDGSDVDEIYTFFSGVALTQSAMDSGHSWHMFAVEERLEPEYSTHESTQKDHSPAKVQRDVSYHYIGSSSAARGRPSSRVMSDAFEEFSEDTAANQE